jgi:hypothetical protein
MTVAVVTVSITMLSGMLATPLVCIGLVMQWLPRQHLVARFTGAAMIISGWLVFGLGQVAARDWPMVAIDALLLFLGVLRVHRLLGAARRGQQ